MQGRPTRCLVVDDERMNREVLAANLRSAGYETQTAEDGEIAWELLDAAPDDYDVILLDRRMPRLDGMGLLARLKGDDRLRQVPVIMQTAFASIEDVAEGIRGGVYYYLAKPLDRRLLMSVTQAAIEEYQRYQRLREDLNRRSNAMALLDQGAFSFRTLDEANTLAVALARACPNSQNLVVGLSEIFTNAIEHGNLGITFEEKTELLNAGRWRQEIEARLDAPQYRNKRAVVNFVRHDDEVRITVLDQGKGFNWRSYLRLDASRAFAAHGRGVAMARSISFDDMFYNDVGNQVTCVIRGNGRGTGWQMAPCAAMETTPAKAKQPVQSNATANEIMARKDMTQAQAMQNHLLPDANLLARIEGEYGLSLSTIFETSESLGGDLWGAKIIDKQRVALWIADFSGHGLTAALNTFRLHTLIQTNTLSADNPALFMTELNRSLGALLPVGHYCTMVYAVINPSQGSITYASAASPHPLCVAAEIGLSVGDGSGLPMGVSQQATYQNRSLAFPKGGKFFMASDALTESATEEGIYLNPDALHQMLQESVETNIQDVNAILAPFLCKVIRPMRDDLTVIVCSHLP